MVHQITKIASLVGWEGLCVIIVNFNAYIQILQCKKPEGMIQRWLNLRFKNQEVSGSSPQLDR